MLFIEYRYPKFLSQALPEQKTVAKKMYFSDKVHLFIAWLPIGANWKGLILGIMEGILNLYHAVFPCYVTSAKSLIDTWISETNQETKSKKVAIITGATSGIGKEIAFGLAKAGYRLVLAARSEKLALQVIQDLKNETKNNDISYLLCDMDSLDSVRSFVDEFLKLNLNLDLLISK